MDPSVGMVLVGFLQVGVHGQAYDLRGHLLGCRGVVGAAQVSVGRLFVERHRVVDGGGDAGGLQPGLEGVAVQDAQGLLGEDAGAVGIWPRKGAERVA